MINLVVFGTKSGLKSANWIQKWTRKAIFWRCFHFGEGGHLFAQPQRGSRGSLRLFLGPSGGVLAALHSSECTHLPTLSPTEQPRSPGTPTHDASSPLLAPPQQTHHPTQDRTAAQSWSPGGAPPKTRWTSWGCFGEPVRSCEAHGWYTSTKNIHYISMFNHLSFPEPCNCLYNTGPFKLTHQKILIISSIVNSCLLPYQCERGMLYVSMNFCMNDFTESAPTSYLHVARTAADRHTSSHQRKTVTFLRRQNKKKTRPRAGLSDWRQRSTLPSSSEFPSSTGQRFYKQKTKSSLLSS